MIIISGTTTTVPFDLARASDCLAAPNSPAPKGSHWYYHLNRETQQKCWYTRSSEKQPQRATAQTSSGDAAVPSTSAGQTGSTAAHDIDGPSGQPEPSTTAIQEPASSTIPNRSASQTAPPEDRRGHPLYEKAAHPTLAFRRPHRPRWYGPIHRRWLQQSTHARLMRWWPDAALDPVPDKLIASARTASEPVVRNPDYSISGSCIWARGDWFCGSSPYERRCRSSRARQSITQRPSRHRRRRPH